MNAILQNIQKALLLLHFLLLLLHLQLLQEAMAQVLWKHPETWHLAGQCQLLYTLHMPHHLVLLCLLVLQQ